MDDARTPTNAPKGQAGKANIPGAGGVTEPRTVPRTLPVARRITPPDGEGPTGQSGLEGREVQGPDAAGVTPELWQFLAPPEAPGEIGRLGPYSVLRVLGTGGMGVVFQAEDPKLKRRVALKAMQPVLAVSETARKRFLREAQAAAAIEHDHIVPILHVGEDRGVPFIAMPLLKGESLAARLKRGQALSVAEVLRVGRDVGRGLAAAHAAGLIHRDIKPANLWLEGDEGRVKILDFGLARAAADRSSLTQSGAIVGTPAYMSPEQAAGQPVDERCDLFSLGCVLYHMCTGRPPFKGPDAVATLVAVAMHHPPPPSELRPGLPDALSDLVMQLLAKKPDDRPRSAKGVVDMLQEIEDRPVRGSATADRPARGREAGAGQVPRRNKPRGSKIKEYSTTNGRVFVWPLGSGVWDYLPYGGSFFITCYVGYHIVSYFWLSPRQLGTSSLLYGIWLPLLLFGPTILYLRPSRPESITLGNCFFRHDLGRPGAYLASTDAHRQHGVDSRPIWRRLLGLPLIVEISKEELGEIIIERDTTQGSPGKLRLRYDAGADRIEIGRYLREPEKEWLAGVLREWQEQPSGDKTDVA